MYIFSEKVGWNALDDRLAGAVVDAVIEAVDQFLS